MAQEQTRQFIEQATQSIQSGQFDGALRLIDQALEIDPNDSDSHVLRAICLSQTGQPAAATDAFNRALLLDPQSAKARYNFAVHLYSQGQKSEALKNARETAHLDPSHAGARQLIATLETELAGPAPQGMANPNDPLSQPPVIPGAAEIPPAPQANPYSSPSAPQFPHSQPSMPSAPPPTSIPSPVHNPYQKSPYEGPAHSLPLVENLGGTWIGIGWALAALSLIGFAMMTLVMVNAMGGTNLNNPEEMTRAVEAQTGPVWIARICGFGSLIGIMVWSIMDIIDRRGNFVWLIPNIICSCCGFGWITLPIYILAGRNN